MAAARIRKAFHYPRDSDDEDEPEEMDEEHQERLISELRREDALKNEMYRTGCLALPLLGVAFFVYALFTSTTARQTLISAMSISSLVCTAYILQYMPIHSPERKGKRPLYQIEAEKGPVEKYLVILNAILAAILLLAAMSNWQKARDAAWREALPASGF